ncbi:MAR-binding filament-like protein 1 [Nicotiana sylvestris]|uniref:MAR-binding filament-like protein 1 n=1 Tax=Nicotiana sylvestris TaxID=4096 RepID=UPI00388C5435
MAEDSELWYVICDGAFIPMTTIGEPTVTIPKTRKEYNDSYRKSIEKNFRAKRILVCSIRPNKYNKISSYQSAKEIWEALQKAHERTTQESKVNAITEAKDLQKLTIGELIGNLKSYEMKKMKDHERRKPKREKNLVLKTNNNDSSGEDADMAYLTKGFQKIVCRNGGIPKRGSSSKPKGYELCHKCRKLGHFIKDCPLHKHDQYKHNTDKATKRNPVLDKRFKRKDIVDNVVKQALAAWGDSSTESGEDDEQGDSSMMAVESESAEYDSIFFLMEKTDEDEEDDDGDVVNFLDVQRNLKSYSQKKLISLAKVLTDTYHNLIDEKNMLTVELDEIEHERDDLVVVVADLKETIESLKKEKDILAERVANVDHERDDLLVVVVDLKEIIEELRRESRHEITQKGKEVASETYLRLENKLKSVKSSMCTKLERNRQLQEDLGRVKNDIEKSLK